MASIKIGDVFGRLTVVDLYKDRYSMTVCVCSCTNKRKVHVSNLLGGRTLSCGCLNSENTAARNATHGEPKTSSEYMAWCAMIQRCSNPNRLDYERYGGRGIRVCAEWRHDFPAFLSHIGRKPSPLHSLDRIRNNQGYEPGNIRWATAKEQSNNRRKRRWWKQPIEFGSVDMALFGLLASEAADNSPLPA
jgi:hypothetical protein